MRIITFIALFLILDLNSFSQVDLNNGLIAYYPFSGNANNAVSNDMHGTINGGLQLTKDRFGNDNSAYLFNGYNSNIIVRSDKLMTPAFSICYYFNTNKTSQQVLTGKVEYTDAVVSTFNSGIFHQNKDAFFGVFEPLQNCNIRVPSTYNYTIFSDPLININEWYCVVNTFEKGIQRIYINGELVKEDKRSFDDATLCTGVDFIIGSWWKQDPWWFSGVIDDVRYYNRAINIDEVRALCIQSSDSLIINDYAAVSDFDMCWNHLVLDDASAFNAGDTVLMIQMKGAVIDSSNTPSFGQISSYGDAGNYEMNIIRSKSGNTVTLEYLTQRNYDFQNGKVQLVRVPYFNDFSFNQTLTALPWDGKKGGVLVLNAAGTVTMNGNIDVSAIGFRHGTPLKSSVITYNAADYYYDASNNNGAEKGEGIYDLGQDKIYGRGAQANGGGGGNAHNTGGGGGANGGNGGEGGDQFQPYKTVAENLGGKGGNKLANSAAINRLFLGGAGGMGHENEDTWFPAGNGGGIIIVSAITIINNGYWIKANGGNATEAPSAGACKDGLPGGGGGGSILLSVLNPGTNLNLEAKGGKGADQISNLKGGEFGPGGGGGGGVIAVSQATLPGSYNPILNGGINGVNTRYGNDPLGAQPGEAGIVIPGMHIPIASVPFIRNIDSVKISSGNLDCLSLLLQGISITNTAPITTWDWSFGDGTISNFNLQMQVHNYTTQGTFPVKLIVTDADGCKDSTQISVNTYVPDITKSADTAICENTSVQLFVSGGTSYNWTPSTLLDDSNSSDPVATPLVTTKFYVDTYIADGCETKDSILVTVNPAPQITMSNDTTICKGTSATLSASGGDTYQWTPDQTLSSNNIFNPVANPVESTKYYVKASSNGCSAEDSVLVSVFPVPNIQLTTEPLICINSEAELTATGGSSYYWTPANLLHSQTGPTVSSQPLQADATFYVEVTDEHTCIYNDSISVKVRAETDFTVSRDTSVCTNNTIQLSASGGDVYDWSPKENIQGSSTSSTITALIDKSMNFSVVITENICHKTETLTVPVSALPLPVVVADKSNDITCSTPTAQLSVTGSGVSFLWTPAETLNNTAIPNPVATPKSNTVYSVKATDVNGCINYDSVLVKTDFTDMSPSVMPNAFTPNGDGLNDCFGVRHLAPIQDLDFRIYNRYGQLIFRTSDPSACWDGTFKGEPQNSGAFAYIVSGRRTCEVVNLKGKVILIR